MLEYLEDKHNYNATCATKHNIKNHPNPAKTIHDPSKPVTFEITFSGHENIRSMHHTTIEITREPHLTPRGDCIVGVGAAVGCKDLPPALKQRIRRPGSHITLIIKVGKSEFVIRGRGHPELPLTHSNDIVIRRSDYICPRTLAVNCDKAADLLPREMVRLLCQPGTVGTFVIVAQ